MHVLNVHKRKYDLPKKEIAKMLKTLASTNDQVWPKEKWPKMKLQKGLSEGSKGGHGPIGYYVQSITEDEVVFKFTKPKGFNGVHKFNLTEISETSSELKHTIDIHIKGKALLLWHFGIRSLHDALIEDGMDKIHNKIMGQSKTTKWSLWVKVLRSILK